MIYPVTPNGRYFVVRGRIWRCSDPRLAPERRQELTNELMAGRREKSSAMRAGDAKACEQARRWVDEVKTGARRTRRDLVDGWRAGLEQTHGP